MRERYSLYPDSGRVTVYTQVGPMDGSSVAGDAPAGLCPGLVELAAHAPDEGARRVDAAGRTWARGVEPGATWYLVDQLPIWKHASAPPR